MAGGSHVGRRTRGIQYKKKSDLDAAPPNSDINVTPLVDVCLVLLIIFMVITPMLGRGKDVPLPKLVDDKVYNEHKEGDQVFVSVDDSGVWINADLYANRDDFVEAIIQQLKVASGKAAAGDSESSSPLLFVKGDKNTNWARVRVVLEWINQADIQDMALVIDNEGA